jgi:hypothetical protein
VQRVVEGLAARHQDTVVELFSASRVRIILAASLDGHLLVGLALAYTM